MRASWETDESDDVDIDPLGDEDLSNQPINTTTSGPLRLGVPGPPRRAFPPPIGWRTYVRVV